MSTMSPDEIRAFVRTHLDVDAEELPNTLLDVFMSDGFNKIIGAFDDSPSWLHVQYTFTSASGTQSYNLDSTDGLLSPSVLQSVEDLRGPRWSLRPAAHRQIRDRYAANSMPSSNPTEWSVWGRTLWLWPEPSSAESITVLGVRRPTDWLALNSAPDCPEEFHRPLALWALGLAYAQQDDPDLAQFYTQSFDREITQLRPRWSNEQDAQPFVVNGGRPRDSWRLSNWPKPAIFDWE